MQIRKNTGKNSLSHIIKIACIYISACSICVRVPASLLCACECSWHWVIRRWVVLRSIRRVVKMLELDLKGSHVSQCSPGKLSLLLSCRAICTGNLINMELPQTERLEAKTVLFRPRLSMLNAFTKEANTSDWIRKSTLQSPLISISWRAATSANTWHSVHGAALWSSLLIRHLKRSRVAAATLTGIVFLCCILWGLHSGHASLFLLLLIITKPLLRLLTNHIPLNIKSWRILTLSEKLSFETDT